MFVIEWSLLVGCTSSDNVCISSVGMCISERAKRAEKPRYALRERAKRASDILIGMRGSRYVYCQN